MMQRALWKGLSRVCDGGGAVKHNHLYAVDSRIMPTRGIDLVVVPGGNYPSVHFFYENEEEMRKEWSFWIDR